jgi:hypothetical protein
LIDSLTSAQFKVRCKGSIPADFAADQIVLLNNWDLRAIPVARKVSLENFVKSGGVLAVLNGKRDTFAKAGAREDSLQRMLPVIRLHRKWDRLPASCSFCRNRPPWTEAFHRILAVNAELKHIVLLTDGRTGDLRNPALAPRASARHVTISTLVLGDRADPNELFKMEQCRRRITLGKQP